VEAPLKRLLVAITGASGAAYGVRLLERVRDLDDVEAHLIVTPAAHLTLRQETDWTLEAVAALAAASYADDDMGAAPASGSFQTCGMIIAPCSVKTLAAVANGHANTLVARAADVTLKEGRPLLALVRETPLHIGHLRHMLALAEMGGIVMPPVPAFYTRPRTVDEIVDQTVARALQRLGLAARLVPEWHGGAGSHG
jgi:flavin prenyltransferase